jgi:dUTP pyrophosphatase
MKPFERALIPTGLYFELPYGYELQIRPRSGYSFKTGLMAILGTVDRDYRGEVKVILINLSDKEVKIEHGDRVAQGVVAPRVSTELGKLIKLTSVEELSETDRGVSGFGSTGNK